MSIIGLLKTFRTTTKKRLRIRISDLVYICGYLLIGTLCLLNSWSCSSIDSKIEENQSIQKQETKLQISERAIRDFLTVWEQSQDSKEFSTYENCYSSDFTGIKRAGNHTLKYNYQDWVQDRRQMMNKAENLDVDIENLKINIEGGTAIVQFTQHYRSRQYADFGAKTLHIKTIHNELKIVFEELGFSTKVHD